MRLKKILETRLPRQCLDRLVGSYDLVGDVAILKIPVELQAYEGEIAAALMQEKSNIRVVAKREGTCSGDFRIAPLQRIGGTGGLQTIHKEYGVRLYVDPSKVYFSPRSGSERHRIAKRVGPEEHVLVMFSGIAPLPLMINHYSRAASIVGVEINPVAHQLALKNIILNRGSTNISLIQGDVIEVMPHLDGPFDRVIMPLPLSGFKYLDIAIEAVASDGWLHYYDFEKKEDFGKAENLVTEACRRNNRKLIFTKQQKCGHVSVGKYRVCVDAWIG